MIVDIRDARRALYTTSPLSLRYMGSIYTDCPPWKEGEEDDDKGLAFTDDEEKLARYNAMDCIVTARCHREIFADSEWQNNRATKRLYNVHTSLSRIAAKMYARGFYVLQGERRRLDAELLSLHEFKLKELLAVVNDSAFRGTPDDMRTLIYARHAKEKRRTFALPDPAQDNDAMWANDDHTKCSVDQGALLHMFVHPMTPDELKEIIQAYWHANAPRKARSTFVTGEKVQQAIGADGKLRAGWNSCGTETMRWSCRDPNLMNLPEGGDDDALGGLLPNLRAMYGPSPGMVLVHSDWSQQELRVMEAVTGDVALRDALEFGDVYSFDAMNWFKNQLPPQIDANALKTKYKSLRKACKIGHLAFQYGAGMDAMHLQILKRDRKATLNATRAIRAAAMKTYAETVAYWQEERENVLQCGYSEGRILGGRIYYPEEPEITKTANTPIQRTAGEMAALAMVQIDRRLEEECAGAGIVVILHDAFDVECKPQQVEKVKQILTEEMEGPWKIKGNKQDVERKFPVEIKVGEKTWAGL